MKKRSSLNYRKFKFVLVKIKISKNVVIIDLFGGYQIPFFNPTELNKDVLAASESSLILFNFITYSFF